MNLPQFPRFFGAAFAVAAALTFVAPASAKVLARVNGAEITDEDVKIALEDIGPSCRSRSKALRAKLTFSITSSTQACRRRKPKPTRWTKALNLRRKSPIIATRS